MATILEEIKSDNWIKLILYLQRLGRTTHISHCKLIKISVVTNKDGDPVWWTEADCAPISPSRDVIQNWLNQL